MPQIMERLADLTTRFGQNVLADEAGYRLRAARRARSRRPARLRPRRGAPGGERARRRRRLGDHAVALADRAVPHLLRAARPARAGVARLDDARRARRRARQPPIAREILALRLEQARLHGYATYADYALADTMAGTPAAVAALLDAGVAAGEGAGRRRSARRCAALALSRGETIEIEPWDWRYYAEKVRQARYELDEAEVKPYFPLERMVDGGVRLRGAPVRPRASSPRPDIAPTTPTSGSTRCAAATARWSACSCTTTSPGRPSAAAPG